MAPEVVAEKSPIAWMELMTKSREMAMQAGGSNSKPKCKTWGISKYPAVMTLSNWTMPMARARI